MLHAGRSESSPHSGSGESRPGAVPRSGSHTPPLDSLLHAVAFCAEGGVVIDIERVEAMWNLLDAPVYAMTVTSENLAEMDAATSAFMVREGVVDMILDFSNALPGVIDTWLMRTRAKMYSVAPGQRRALIAPENYIYGMFRLYTSYRDNAHQGSAPAVVRTIDEALAALQIDPNTFKPVKI